MHNFGAKLNISTSMLPEKNVFNCLGDNYLARVVPGGAPPASTKYPPSSHAGPNLRSQINMRQFTPPPPPCFYCARPPASRRQLRRAPHPASPRFRQLRVPRRQQPRARARPTPVAGIAKCPSANGVGHLRVSFQTNDRTSTGNNFERFGSNLVPRTPPSLSGPHLGTLSWQGLAGGPRPRILLR